MIEISQINIKGSFNDDDDVGVDGAENCLYNDDKYDGQQQKLGISIWQKGKSALSN